MKLFHAPSAGQKAFTFTEMMVTCALGVMVITGILTGHLVGVRMFQYTKTKLGGNDEARKAISTMIEEIRTAKIIRVGQGDIDTFKGIAIGSNQVGNAIQIYPTSKTNVFIRYFLAGDNTLRRLASGTNAAPVMANWITNKTVFAAEDYKGNVLTNNENNRVIALNLQFYQIQYPVIKIGSNQLYDFYQVRTKVTRRMLE